MGNDPFVDFPAGCLLLALGIHFSSHLVTLIADPPERSEMLMDVEGPFRTTAGPCTISRAEVGRFSSPSSNSSFRMSLTTSDDKVVDERGVFLI